LFQNIKVVFDIRLKLLFKVAAKEINLCDIFYLLFLADIFSILF